MFLVGLVAAFFGCSGGDDRDSRLVVGMELAYPPFEMTDEQGQPSGISVELAEALGAYLDREVVIQNIPFDGLIPALRTGRVDVVISSMTATEERARSIDFSEPYLHTGLCLLVGLDSGIAGIEELNQPGRVVAVKRGTTAHIYAREHLTEPEVLVFDREGAAVLEVVQGKVDGFIYDQMSIYRHWQRNQETTAAILEPFQREAWAVGVAKGRPELVEQVNEFLAEFRARGGFDELGDRYLGEEKAAFAELGYPFYF